MLYISVIAIYVLLLLGVAVIKSRQVKTQDDFMVAGRHVPVLLLVGTLVCTWIGSGSLFGGAGLAFRTGFSALWLSAGAWVGIVVVYFLAHRVRRIAEYTVPDILEKRYNKWARVLGTIAVIIAYMTIAGYQFRGGGRLLSIVTEGGISPTWGAVITCGVIILFTVLAGMLSIVSIDIFNGAVMLVAVLLAVPFALKGAGGWSGVTGTLPADHFALFGSKDAVWAAGVFFPTFLLLLGESSMYQKFFSAKNAAAARKAVIGMIVGVVVIEVLLATVAVIGSSLYWTDSAFADAAITETIIIQVAALNMPVIAGALLLAAGVAIILSTGNTFLMIPATNLTRDIYQRFINPKASDQTIIRFQRIMIVLLGVTALLLASQFTTILAMAFTAYTMVGAGITPALLAAFLWKRTTTAGGVASIAVGMGVTLAITIINWFFQSGSGHPWIETDYIVLPAASLSILTLVAVSLATPAPAREKWAPFYDTESEVPVGD
ncbi:MAG: sodium:solute symporter family protein [Gemmatimonadota bacterium]